MLCQFTFKNFKSYRDETVFDFQAAKLAEFSDSLISAGASRSLLPVSVIYGPNGGGKSNVIDALSSLIALVMRPVIELSNRPAENLGMLNTHKIRPFAFSETSKNEPTVFSVFFIAGDSEYRYLVSILAGRIISEELYRRRSVKGARTTMVFQREEDDIKLSPLLRKNHVNTNVNPELTFLSFLAINYRIDVISDVADWFRRCIYINYSSPLSELSIPVVSNEQIKKKMLDFFRDMDISITDYRVETDGRTGDVFTQHSTPDGTYEINMDQESQGTQKMFKCLPIVTLSLAEGRLLLADELDAKLHPKLLRYIISLYKNPDANKNGAQLMFTSHDLTTMTAEVFRRDEIWFASKDNSQSSTIYSLYDLKNEDDRHISADSEYNLEYLEGRYGADPYLRQMISWEE